MPDPIQLSLDTNAAQIVRGLARFPAAMIALVARAMDVENELTVGDIDARKLSRRGPKTLGVRTNRLRSSIRAKQTVVTGLTAQSSIGSNVVYAGAHEFGFSGTVPVRAHTRRRLTYAGDGRKTYKRMDARGRIHTVSRKARSTAEVILVRAHPMKMATPERAYIRSTIQERAPRYSAAVSAAIVTAWHAAS